MVSRDEILKGQTIPDIFKVDYEINLAELMCAINEFADKIDEFYGEHIPLIVSSGYRTPEHNANVGGAKASAHLYCLAVDLKDNDNLIKSYILENPQVLEECGLYMEHQDYTPTWCHLQTRKTSKRIFRK
jgi:hypothetical protein